MFAAFFWLKEYLLFADTVFQEPTVPFFGTLIFYVVVFYATTDCWKVDNNNNKGNLV